VVVLGVASVLLGIGAESRRRDAQPVRGVVATGELVNLVAVVDGDTVLAQSASGERVTIRIAGIKSFDANAKDETGRFGQRAVDDLRRMFGGKPIRVELEDPPLDRYGRTIATLFVDDEDVGLLLVRSGTTLVYTAHPFSALTRYLVEESEARGERRGMWGSPDATRRADALRRRWGVPPR
jgi:micrococcal nuclease